MIEHHHLRKQEWQCFLSDGRFYHPDCVYYLIHNARLRDVNVRNHHIVLLHEFLEGKIVHHQYHVQTVVDTLLKLRQGHYQIAYYRRRERGSTVSYRLSPPRRHRDICTRRNLKKLQWLRFAPYKMYSRKFACRSTFHEGTIVLFFLKPCINRDLLKTKFYIISIFLGSFFHPP